jgi:hypothetical protein
MTIEEGEIEAEEIEEEAVKGIKEEKINLFSQVQNQGSKCIYYRTIIKFH